MTEQERIMMIESDQRSKSNTHRIDSLEEEIHDIKNEQKAIYKIATSVEVIAQRVTNIEEKIDDTNRKMDAQSQAWQETEQKLTAKAQEIEHKPYKEMADNMNHVKVAVITAVCTLLATGAVSAILSLMK